VTHRSRGQTVKRSRRSWRARADCRAEEAAWSAQLGADPDRRADRPPHAGVRRDRVGRLSLVGSWSGLVRPTHPRPPCAPREHVRALPSARTLALLQRYRDARLTPSRSAAKLPCFPLTPESFR
jgi:hypothetical protein